jgi:hypothetical protein
MLRRMVTAKGATYLSVYDAFCRNDRCGEADDVSN